MGLRPLRKLTELETEQAYWYAKLASEGFIDIESTTRPDRPLLCWTQNKRIGLSSQPELSEMVSSLPSPLFTEEEIFLDNPEFESVVISAAKHKNNSLDSTQITILWRLHTQGISNRKIALKLKTSEASIRRNIRKIVSWMGIV